MVSSLHNELYDAVQRTYIEARATKRTNTDKMYDPVQKNGMYVICIHFYFNSVNYVAFFLILISMNKSLCFILYFFLKYSIMIRNGVLLQNNLMTVI